jgi:hypothetical protein
MKLKGPKDVSTTLIIEGKKYVVANGTITPEIPDALVPDVVWSWGFVRVQTALYEEEKKPKPNLGGKS